MKFRNILVLIFLSLISISMVNANILSKFPNNFVKDNTAKVTFILGVNAQIYDGIAASLILASMQRYYLDKGINFIYTFVVDKDVDSLKDINAIVIGGSCVNMVTAELFEYPLRCSAPFKPGKGRIKAFSNNIIFVGGYYWQDTINAAKALSNFRKIDFESDDVEIESEEYAYLMIS
ncbi:MAG: hypothetical protein QXR30_00190 [Candidatus Woesearchaeota archaeon]